MKKLINSQKYFWVSIFLLIISLMVSSFFYYQVLATYNTNNIGIDNTKIDYIFACTIQSSFLLSLNCIYLIFKNEKYNLILLTILEVLLVAIEHFCYYYFEFFSEPALFIMNVYGICEILVLLLVIFLIIKLIYKKITKSK
jgi:hypothetical protein